jgi:hypothetical protein
MRTSPSGAQLHPLLRDRRTQHVAQQHLPARRVQSARPRRRVQSETIERRAQRLIVGERVRLEGREATHPLRPGRRRLAPDRRCRLSNAPRPPDAEADARREEPLRSRL